MSLSIDANEVPVNNRVAKLKKLSQFALFGFCLSLLAHVLCVIGVNWNTGQPVLLMLLFCGSAIALFAPTTLTDFTNSRNIHPQFWASLPKKINVVFGLLFVCLSLNAFIFFYSANFGIPRNDNGIYFLDFKDKED